VSQVWGPAPASRYATVDWMRYAVSTDVITQKCAVDQNVSKLKRMSSSTKNAFLRFCALEAVLTYFAKTIWFGTLMDQQTLASINGCNVSRPEVRRVVRRRRLRLFLFPRERSGTRWLWQAGVLTRRQALQGTLSLNLHRPIRHIVSGSGWLHFLARDVCEM